MRRAKSRTVNGQLIGSKRNNVKVASRKRIQRLIDIQQDQDRLRKLRHGIDDMLDQQAAQPPREHPYISFDIPTPKRPTSQVPIITQDDIAAAATTPAPTSERTYTFGGDEELHQYSTPASIAPDALYSYLGDAMLNETHHFVPESLMSTWVPIAPPPDIEELCCGVVHPVTNETITKYHKVIAEPLLREVWMKAMCVELGRLAFFDPRFAGNLRDRVQVGVEQA